MFCKYCGAELPDGAKVCGYCQGQTDPIPPLSVENPQEQPPETSALNAKKFFSGIKKKYVIVAVVVLVVLVAGIAMFVNLALPKLEANAEINTLEKQIEKREYHTAYQVYEELDSANRTKANKWLREYIDSVEEDYYEGKLDYPTATGILSELLPFEAVSNKISKAGDNIYLDNQSTIAFEKAKEYAEDKKWQEAYEALQDIHIKYRLYDDVADLRTEYLDNYRDEVLEHINDFAKREEIDKLIEARDSALKVIPDDKEIIQTSQKHLDTFVKNTLANAAALAEKKDYDSAMELLQYAANMYDHEDLWEALNGYGYDAAKAHCEALVAKNDLLGAVKYAKGLSATDSVYNNILSQYADQLVTSTLAKAKEYADKRQFSDAIALIITAQEVYDCSELQTASENYSTYLPRKLSECHQIDCSYYVEENDYIDSFGAKHEDAIRFNDRYQNTYAVYNLGSKYVSLTGSIVADEDHDSLGAVKIYVDTRLVFECTAIDRTTEASTFSLDITGGKQLRIEVLNDRDHGYLSTILVDATVS